MKSNSADWLMQKGGYDDCGITSVGGAAYSLSSETELRRKFSWKHFPVKEMIKRGWITGEKAIGPEFFDLVPGWDRLCPLFHKTTIRCNKQVDAYSLAAWTARVVLKAQDELLTGRFRANNVNLSLMTEIARLSESPTGPQEAKKELSERGIALIIEPHLPRTYLDGAALLATNDLAIIGLTIRYDRIDNFWYCLMHELAHLALHVGGNQEAHFFDDFDTNEGIDSREKEADELACEALIPKAKWDESAAKLLPSKEAAGLLAKELSIHPAIVAGRIRFKSSYVFVSELIGQGTIRPQFPNIKWS